MSLIYYWNRYVFASYNRSPLYYSSFIYAIISEPYDSICYSLLLLGEHYNRVYLGRVVIQPDEIKHKSEDVFRNFLKHKLVDFEETDVATVQNPLTFRCSTSVQTDLTKEVTADEITKVILNMPNDK